MSLPQMNFKFNDLDEAKNLQEVTEQKLSSLVKYIPEDTDSSCDFEFSKIAAGQNGQIFRAEANFKVDGAMYRAEATENSFEQAVDEVRSELDKEMRRAKEKQSTLDKQSGREAKEQMLNDNQTAT